jgi:DNA integrity scanning protein DisA with diadenylate cyclase activity
MTRTDHIKESILEAGIAKPNAPYLDTLVGEVEYAMYPPTHEQTKPTYGCLLARNNPKGKLALMSMSDVEIATIRQLADGITTFAVRNNRRLRHIALNATSSDEELGLIDLVKKVDGILIHRSAYSVVKVIKRSGIYINHDALWTFRPMSSSSVYMVEEQARQAGRSMLESILRFAFHVLSPVHIGATLVWWLDEPTEPIEDKYKLSSTGLSLAGPAHFNALRSLLSAHDGATYIMPSGTIHSIGHHLTNSDKSREFISQVHGKGTRHTSAQRFSFDEPRVIVFTVSVDGPVSVFSDGIKVIELQQKNLSGVARSLRKLVPAKADDVWEESSHVQCMRCGRHIEVDIIVIAGLRERETGECPVCGEVVYTKSCWQINTRVVKRLPGEESRFLL